MSVIGACIVPHPPLIVPEIGKGQEAAIQSTIDAYNEVARHIAELKPDTLVVATPHSVMYADYFHISPGENAKGDLSGFGAPRVKFAVEYDKELAATISEAALSSGHLCRIPGRAR